MQYDLAMHELGSWQSPMLRQLFTPRTALKPYIKDYCVLRQEWACNHRERWYILPDNCAYLIFYLVGEKDNLKPSLRLIGPRSRHLVINRRHRHFTFMVSFRPGALAAFSKIDIADLCDRSIDASDLLPWANQELIDRLAIAARHDPLTEFIETLEAALVNAAHSITGIHPVIQEFARLTLEPQLRVADISNKLGITERHLRTLSQKHIGHSPKSMLQIERFTRSLVISNHSREWASIAHESGYYDQSHMIAEYQKMTGKSPERLFG